MHYATKKSIRNAISKHSLSRVEHLFELLNAKFVEPNQWRMPTGTIIDGRLEDFARSVDCVKQLEAWVAAEETRKRGYSEFFLHVSSIPPYWYAEVQHVQGEVIACSKCKTSNEALARIEALIEYVKSTGMA